MANVYITEAEEYLLMVIAPHELNADVNGPFGNPFSKKNGGKEFPELFKEIFKARQNIGGPIKAEHNSDSLAAELSEPGGRQTYLRHLKELFVEGSSITTDIFPWDYFYYARALFHEHYDNIEEAVQDYRFARLCSPFEQWFYDQEASLLIKMDRQEDAMNTLDDLLMWSFETREERQDAHDIIHRLIPMSTENIIRYQFSQDG